MELSKIINSIGLVIDIVGAIMIFKFGLPPALENNRDFTMYVGSDEIDHEAIKKDKRFQLFNKIGLWLLVGGFTCQLASNFIK